MQMRSYGVFINTSDMTLLKNPIASLVERRDYKTLSMLLRHNHYVNIFDTRSLNEDIPQSDKRFAKRNGKLRNVAKSTDQSISNSQIQYYELNIFIQTSPKFRSYVRAKYY